MENILIQLTDRAGSKSALCRIEQRTSELNQGTCRHIFKYGIPECRDLTLRRVIDLHGRQLVALANFKRCNHWLHQKLKASSSADLWALNLNTEWDHKLRMACQEFNLACITQQW